jgi:hypothetical protein
MDIDQTGYQLLIAGIGIAGTLLGTITGWFLNKLSQRGKLTFYVKNWSNKFNGEISSNGCPTIAKRFDEATSYTYEVSIDMYNSSGNNRIIRDVRLGFYKNKELIISQKPDNKETQKFVSQSIRYDKFRYENIPPKELRHIELKGSIQKSELDSLKGINAIKMMYVNEKGKEKMVSMAFQTFEECFQNEQSTE